MAIFVVFFVPDPLVLDTLTWHGVRSNNCSYSCFVLFSMEDFHLLRFNKKKKMVSHPQGRPHQFRGNSFGNYQTMSYRFGSGLSTSGFVSCFL